MRPVPFVSSEEPIAAVIINNQTYIPEDGLTTPPLTHARDLEGSSKVATNSSNTCCVCSSSF